MKKLFLFTLINYFLLCNVNKIDAQMVYMPDSMLRLKLTSLGYGSCIIGDSIDALCSTISGVLNLDLSNSSISDLRGIETFGSLKQLFCNGNQLTSLPIFPQTLRSLSCQVNQIATINNLPDSLQSLMCEFNLITAISSFPSTLTILDVSSNRLTTLPLLPPSLKYLICSNNLLTSLPALPFSLVSLLVGDNQLTSLPSLPPSLKDLRCFKNQLIVLPPLPNSLLKLMCDNNQLITLPTLTPSLNYLDCWKNQLTMLPTLPDSLNTLLCGFNQIVTLPVIPRAMKNLKCGGNLLSEIPDLPDSLDILNCEDNPQLYCLPKLKAINSLSFRNCPISCLPNYGNVTSSMPLIDDIPLCDIFNINQCDVYWNINGKVFVDPDFNCMQSINESGVLNAHIQLFENGNLIQQVFSGPDGFFSFDVNNSGIFEVRMDTSNIPLTVNCPNANTYFDTIVDSSSLIYGNDFALKCKGSFDLAVESVISTRPRPGRHAIVHINAGDIANLFQMNCAVGVSGSIIVSIDGPAHYSGSLTSTPSFISIDSIIFSIPDFGTINSNTDFVFEILTDTNAAIGDLVCFNVWILPVAGDNNPSNNFLTQCFSVRNSFDPNEKDVYPSGIIDTTEHWLTYTVHFQNLGNAPAENIYVLDTLDATIDLSTFQLLSTSHPSFVQILEDGIARFNFSNINLSDSMTNEPMSHGYLQYKVKLKDNLPIGTQIHNTAYVYFDFNAPVVTNTTSNTIDIVNGISEQGKLKQIKVWPVPFENNFIIQTDELVTGSHFSIMNLIGSEIKNGKINSTQMKINSEAWTPGIYFLRIDSKSGSIINKLIKK